METPLSNQISWQMDVNKGRLEKLGYDMIIGKDLLWAPKITINLKYQVIKWKDTSIPVNGTKLAVKRKKSYMKIFN